MNYEDMSDFEINKKVVEHLPLRESDGINKSKLPSEIIVNDIISEYAFDPCNNPSDAWPIIVENKIAIRPHTFENGQWGATDGMAFPEHQHWDKNPLRAAMICFIKMKESES